MISSQATQLAIDKLAAPDSASSIAKRFVHALGGEIGESARRQHIWVKMPVGHTDAPGEIKSHFHICTPSRSLTVLWSKITKSTGFVAREMLQLEGLTS
jgi:hypothetical protein